MILREPLSFPPEALWALNLLKEDCLSPENMLCFPHRGACEEATQPGMPLLASDLLAVYISVTLQLGLHAPTLPYRTEET